MTKPIYYTKVLFVERHREEQRTLIDLVNRNLSFGVYNHIPKLSPIADGYIINDIGNFHVKIVNNCKTGFKDEIVTNYRCTTKEVFLKGFELSDNTMNNLLKLCNALEFEPYRDKEPTMFEPGFIGYRDETSLRFTGITNSYLPKLDINMCYFYDKEHTPPTEKLYRYVYKNILEHDKECSKWLIGYGGLSLFF